MVGNQKYWQKWGGLCPVVGIRAEDDDDDISDGTYSVPFHQKDYIIYTLYSI